MVRADEQRAAGRPARPSDTAIQTFTYDQMLASQRGFYSTAPWLIVIGAVVTAACGWGEYRWRRNRALYRATQSGKPV
jgi:hypothetical protein